MAALPVRIFLTDTLTKGRPDESTILPATVEAGSCPKEVKWQAVKSRAHNASFGIIMDVYELKINI